MNHQQHTQIISFIWGIADDVLRDVFVRGKYRDVILPMTVLRRLDALLEPTKQKVLDSNRFLEEQGIDLKTSLESVEHGSGLPFYNTSPWTLKQLAIIVNEAECERCFKEYLDGFSANVRDIIDKFRLRDQLKTLVEARALRLLIEKFTSDRINLSPRPVLSPLGAVVREGLENRGMGYVFEELLRRFNEENNEEAGEHFTPRDIIELMTHLVFDPIADQLADQAPLHLYDDACGSGGMLTIAREKLEAIAARDGKHFPMYLYGQEVNPETFAICQSDMLISGQDPRHIVYGSTLSQDGHKGASFDFMLANPPYGKSWKKDQDAILDTRGKEVQDPRFVQTLPGGERLRLIPASSDGQLLFTVNMLTKMKATALGSRVAVVHNGSALFTGDAGSGESNIRRWMLENDWLEAIVGLPLRMFYNTGIATYVWICSNRKTPARRGRVQLIDASQQFHKLRKNLGQKGHEFTAADIAAIVATHLDAAPSPTSKLFANSDFLYRKICVERPLRLRVDLDADPGDQSIVAEMQQRLREALGPGPLLDFTHAKLWAEYKLNAKWKAKDWALFRAACCTRDENAAPVYVEPSAEQYARVGLIVVDERNLEHPEWAGCDQEPDPQLRDWENVPFRRDVPFDHDIGEYFETEVRPHVPDAWVDPSKTQIGAEISFTKYFYKPTPLRPLSDITREILDLERGSEGVLHRLATELTAA